MIGSQPPDQAVRDRISTDLDESFLVEAGAGSGKTRQLLRRMVALVKSGHAKIDQIAAVTFTRKAAAELRERFQIALERSLKKAQESGDAEVTGRLSTALTNLERGFIGTIHSFCARLLRERPLEAGLDPSFREIFGPEEIRSRREAWVRHLERLMSARDASLARLSDVSLKALQLRDCYEFLSDQADVTFPAPEVPVPRCEHVRWALERLLEKADTLMPRDEPEKGWDGLQRKIRQLHFLRRLGWEEEARLLEALDIIVDRKLDITLIRWSDSAEGKERARELKAQFEEFAAVGGEAHAALMQWRAHRYPIAIDFASTGAAAYAAERRRTGQLTFGDLLMEAARLLRESRTARRDLQDRYRYVLVDEFQDTDPIQAEVVFLLTSSDPTIDDWRQAVPKPGSLFVVGDPKQSIYRFRRADIAVYNQVKSRFEEFGEVLELTSNFRSRAPIETFVNEVFSQVFPAKATPQQAAFAPLNVQEKDHPRQGVYWYGITDAKNNMADIARADAEAIATWISARLDNDDCEAGEFLVLTYRKQMLHEYAAALERRNIPVQVTGSGIGIARELEELILLLRAFADPDNDVLTLAVLVGLFFGLDYEELAEYRLAGGSLGFMRPIDEPESAVESALARLHTWWKRTRDLPADAAIAGIVEELGLLPYTATGELGASNAGALAYVIDSIRAATLSGDSSLDAALQVLDEALDNDDAEAPLQPGREDVVRVMNLHKAKGLEGEVVILAHPTGLPKREPEHFIERPSEGQSIGHMLVKTGGRPDLELARPGDWETYCSRELPYKEAEYQRLLYVAATRAKRELVISVCEKSKKDSPWAPFYAHLDSCAEEMVIEATPPPSRTQATRSTAEILAEVEATEERRRELGRESYRIESVTSRAKGGDDQIMTATSGRGAAWGSAVHAALETAGKGASSQKLRDVSRTILLDNELPTNAEGEPQDLDELVALVDAVLTSEVWRRARDAEQLLIEVPFSVSSGTRETDPQGTTARDDQLDVLEGIIDLAFKEPDGWVLADYKTDQVDDPAILEQRLERYREQVDLYAFCWQNLTGEPVKERRILWLGMERPDEVW